MGDVAALSIFFFLQNSVLLYTQLFNHNMLLYNEPAATQTAMHVLSDQHLPFHPRCPVRKKWLKMEQKIIWDLLVRGWGHAKTPKTWNLGLWGKTLFKYNIHWLGKLNTTRMKRASLFLPGISLTEVCLWGVKLQITKWENVTVMRKLQRNLRGQVRKDYAWEESTVDSVINNQDFFPPLEHRTQTKIIQSCHSCGPVKHHKRSISF